MNEQQTPHGNFCPQCGKQLSEGASFCGACGCNLNGQPMRIPQQIAPTADTRPLRTSDYFILLLLSAIPFVGFILMLVWAFSSDTNINRRNFCRANLLMYLISFVLSLILIIVYTILFAAIIEQAADLDMFYTYSQILPSIFH